MLAGMAGAYLVKLQVADRAAKSEEMKRSTGAALESEAENTKSESDVNK
jgi:hypothetical protein